MRTLLRILMVSVALVLAGCMQNGNVTGPAPGGEINFVKLPSVSGEGHGAEYSISRNINGSTGGSLEISRDIAAGSYGRIVLKASLSVPAGAFVGSRNVKLALSDAATKVSCFPSGISFKKAPTLTLEYRGLNLTGLNPASLDFVYKKCDGSFDHVEYDMIEVDVTTGMLKVRNVRLPQSSLYGFID